MHNVYTIDSNLCLNVLLFCFDLCSLEAALMFAMLACQIFEDELCLHGNKRRGQHEDPARIRK
jgi:hypothetical protein